MRDRGWKVNRPFLEKIRRETSARKAELEQRFADPEIVAANAGQPLNPRSGIQVAKTLMALGIDDKARQDNRPDLIRTNMETLERHRGEHWVVDLLLENSGLEEKLSKAEHYLEFTGEDDIMHPGYNWGGRTRESKGKGTATARLSSSEPNVMNAPEWARPAFISRFEGGKILQADYSQLELRIVASVAGEEGLLEEMNKEGGDPHGAAAKRVGEIVGKLVERQVGKRLNFAAVYGSASKTIMEQIEADSVKLTGKRTVIRYKEVKDMYQAWWASHPRVKSYMNDLHMEAVSTGQVVGLFGQARHLPDAMSHDESKRARALRQLGNFPIQNAGAYITMHAMSEVDRLFRDAKLKSVLIAQLHDSIYVDVFPGEEETVKQLVEHAMVERMNRLYYLGGANWYMKPFMKVPLQIDMKIGLDMAGTPAKMEPRLKGVR